MNFFGTKEVEIPKGYSQDWQTKAYYKEQEGEKRAATTRDIEQLHLPALLGDNPSEHRKTEEGDFTRFGGYFPLFGFYTGVIDMGQAISMVYNRVVRGDNKVRDLISSEKLEKVKNHEGPVTLEKRAVVKVDLSASQKLNIVAKSILLWARGLITFCQLGIVFAPFDAAASWYYKKA